MIGSKSWPKLCWLSIVLDEGPSAQISRNLGNFFVNFEFFRPNHRFSYPTRSTTWRALTFERYNGGKIDIFGFFMKIYAFSRMAEEFYQVLSCLKGQKHPKIGLSATFCTHRKHCWEIELLEGKMDTKSRNSTWVGKQTGKDFQRAIMSSIWTSGRASKSAPKLCYAQRFWARRIEDFGLFFTQQLIISPSFGQFHFFM